MKNLIIPDCPFVVNLISGRVTISKTVMKNKPGAEQRIRKGLSDIEGFLPQPNGACSLFLERESDEIIRFAVNAGTTSLYSK